MDAHEKKLLALCGIAGPLIYVFIVLVLASLTPGYSHVADYMSELGATGAPYALVMNTLGFFLLGILMVGFAVGLHYGIRQGSEVGPLLIATSGIFIILTGIFSCDPGCVNSTIIGELHDAFAMTIGVAFAIAPFAIAQRLYEDKRWKNYFWFTLAIGVLSAFFGMGFIFIKLSGWMGAVQRLSMAIPMFWMEVMAIRLYRQA
jgi:hypothetical membrane protein